MSRPIPPSQRSERQKTPEALGQWALRHRKHWQSAHAILTKMGYQDHVLISSPAKDWEEAPYISFLPRSEAMRLPLPAYLLGSLTEPPMEGRFYILATSKAASSYIGLMAPDGGYLPKVTMAPWGSELGIIVDPKTIQD